MFEFSVVLCDFFKIFSFLLYSFCDGECMNGECMNSCDLLSRFGNL